MNHGKHICRWIVNLLAELELRDRSEFMAWGGSEEFRIFPTGIMCTPHTLPSFFSNLPPHDQLEIFVHPLNIHHIEMKRMCQF